MIGGEAVRVFLFVATLGYSRRIFVQAFRHERQTAWLDGIEGAFRHFGGLPAEVLLDNARALVDAPRRADPRGGVQRTAARLRRYWGVRPRACAPYRARTKGKDERGVGYVKRNAIAGRSFASWAALEAHLAWWMREVADRRVHGTTGEPPIERFERDEATALRPLDGRPPFRQVRELVRRVQSDCAVEVDTNAYSVPWRLIGERVQVTVADGWVRVFHAGDEVAAHAGSRWPASAARRAGALPGRAWLPAASRRARPGTCADAGSRARTAAAACRVRARHRGRLVTMVDHEALVGMLGRLQLTAIRDQLDSLLDEAARREMTLREALAFLCEREVARRDERRIEMAAEDRALPLRARRSTASTSRPSPRSIPSRSASSRPAASSPTAKRCCCWGRPASARRISPWRSAARRSARATRSCSPPPRPWSPRSPRRTPKAGWRSGSPSSPSPSC